jgi:hypothetical protein
LVPKNTVGLTPGDAFRTMTSNFQVLNCVRNAVLYSRHITASLDVRAISVKGSTPLLWKTNNIRNWTSTEWVNKLPNAEYELTTSLPKTWATPSRQCCHDFSPSSFHHNSSIPGHLLLILVLTHRHIILHFSSLCDVCRALATTCFEWNQSSSGRNYYPVLHTAVRSPWTVCNIKISLLSTYNNNNNNNYYYYYYLKSLGNKRTKNKPLCIITKNYICLQKKSPASLKSSSRPPEKMSHVFLKYWHKK